MTTISSSSGSTTIPSQLPTIIISRESTNQQFDCNYQLRYQPSLSSSLHILSTTVYPRYLPSSVSTTIPSQLPTINILRASTTQQFHFEYQLRYQPSLSSSIPLLPSHLPDINILWASTNQQFHCEYQLRYQTSVSSSIPLPVPTEIPTFIIIK